MAAVDQNQPLRHAGRYTVPRFARRDLAYQPLQAARIIKLIRAGVTLTLDDWSVASQNLPSVRKFRIARLAGAIVCKDIC